MASQFVVPMQLQDVAKRIETGPRRIFFLPNPHAVVSVLVAADAEAVVFVIQGGMQVAPFWWLKTARLEGRASHYHDGQVRLDVALVPFSLQQVGLWVLLVLMGLILLRLRLAIGVPYMMLLLGWIAASVWSTVGDINQLLHELFGPAVPMKRD